MLKKVVAGVCGSLVVGASSLVLFSNSSVTADDNVTIEMFNDLKLEVEILRNDVENLISENKNLQTEISNLNDSITSKDNEISKLRTELNTTKTELNNKINSNVINISNITEWQKKGYELGTQNVTQWWLWQKLEEFRKTQ